MSFSACDFVEAMTIVADRYGVPYDPTLEDDEALIDLANAIEQRLIELTPREP